MSKDIYKYSDVRDKINSGINKISEPVIQTLTPKGKNVIYQDRNGDYYVTNDGITIAKSIEVEDPVEQAIIDIIRQSALKTNSLAGDGTTTSILLSADIIKNGFKILDGGINNMDLKRHLDKVSEILSNEIKSRAKKISNDKDLEFIATISANNDLTIAKDVAKIIKKSGQDGLVFIENHNKLDTEIIEEDGFSMSEGMFSPHLANQKGKFAAVYADVPVFITDKRLYYEEEVMAILQAVHDMGENRVVIVAADFIGQAPNMLIANHTDPKVNMNILLVKQSKTELLEDLATYLKTQVVSEKRGSFVNKLLKNDFAIAKKVFSDNARSIFQYSGGKNIPLSMRIEAIRKSIEESKEGSHEEQELKKRLASLTNGVTTIRVGGKTFPEVREKMFRYEDSINATRNALKDGYVVGGGITLWNIYNKEWFKYESLFPPEIDDLVKKFCQAPLRQIAINCNLHLPTLLEKITDKIGYNANNEKYEDLFKAGVIEPVNVLRMAVENSISVGQVVLSSDYLIVNKKENNEQDK